MTVTTNEIIAKLADDKAVFYLDIGPEFLTADGTLEQGNHARPAAPEGEGLSDLGGGHRADGGEAVGPASSDASRRSARRLSGFARCRGGPAANRAQRQAVIGSECARSADAEHIVPQPRATHIGNGHPSPVCSSPLRLAALRSLWLGRQCNCHPNSRPTKCAPHAPREVGLGFGVPLAEREEYITVLGVPLAEQEEYIAPAKIPRRFT